MDDEVERAVVLVSPDSSSPGRCGSQRRKVDVAADGARTPDGTVLGRTDAWLAGTCRTPILGGPGIRPKPARRKFILAAGATATSIGLAGCSSNGDDGDADDTDGADIVGADGTDDTEPGDGTDSGDETEATDGTSGDVDPSQVEGETDEVSQYVEVVSHEAYADGEDVGVRGTVENTSDQALDVVEVEVTFDDEVLTSETTDTISLDADLAEDGTGTEGGTDTETGTATTA